MCKRKRNILQFSYDIEECIDVIQEEISKVSFEEFVNDRKTIGYIERQLEKIGEAISQIQKLDKNILTDIFSDHSYWENIKGIRNRLIHEYWGTSLEMIYEVSVFEMEDLLKYIYLLREKLKY
ncbi:HepT-like ribonuclease domain-containing protein [uncultured Leptotrichia sp.]|jgi:putative toxin-antitoxin system, antitoxin component|uniref:HepT-like ribonuclease domain-containing protein n=1 Tax=uncultured Leptotrichia sp. TaxID=159271 RepID=UPI00261809C1|nr:HepT-like ribonuclease domain-containing protein [uncultured Leptotrichia sp.]